MLSEIKKEIMYSLRTGKLFIILMSLMFLSVLTPIMLKVILPELLQWQFPQMPIESIGAMINASQTSSIVGFLSDLFELGLIIIVFTLGGLVASELSENTLVFPLISNKRIHHVLLSKIITIGASITLILMSTLIINYAYAGLLFEFEVEFAKVLSAGLLMSLYFVFVIANIMFWGVFIKKSIPASFITLLICYGLSAIGGLLNIHQFLPSGLTYFASTLSFQTSGVLNSVAITLGVIVVMMIVAILKISKMELNTR